MKEKRLSLFWDSAFEDDLAFQNGLAKLKKVSPDIKKTLESAEKFFNLIENVRPLMPTHFPEKHYADAHALSSRYSLGLVFVAGLQHGTLKVEGYRVTYTIGDPYLEKPDLTFSWWATVHGTGYAFMIEGEAEFMKKLKPKIEKDGWHTMRLSDVEWEKAAS